MSRLNVQDQYLPSHQQREAWRPQLDILQSLPLQDQWPYRYTERLE